MKFKYIFAKLLIKLKPSALKDCFIDKKAKVGHGSNFINVRVGKYTYFGNNNSICNANFGSYCSIASNCSIGGGNHQISNFSTSVIFERGKNIFNENFSYFEKANNETVTIGNDVWIGENSFIKPGVTIGNGSIIGAHSVVTKDVEPYSIVCGVPAKVMKYRFDFCTIQKLQLIEWWNINPNILKIVLKDRPSVDVFIKRIEDFTK